MICRFSSEVPIDDMQRDGACVRFTLMDYNFVVKNDFGGEAYVAMNSVPGVFSPVKAIQSRRMSQLVFMKPQTIAGKMLHIYYHCMCTHIDYLLCFDLHNLNRLLQI